jgi:tRNA(adenine34) deaminase
MSEALKLAKKAYAIGEIPVGAVVVHGDTVIGRGFNRRETDRNPLAHAEMLAIKQAAEYLDAWRLLDCDLYVTLQPCIMCQGAVCNARIRRLFFGAYARPHEELFRGFSYKPESIGGILEQESSELLKYFFRELRGCY